jgi:hypothetical protein
MKISNNLMSSKININLSCKTVFIWIIDTIAKPTITGCNLDLMLKKNTKASLNFVIEYLVRQNINTPKEACHGEE